MGSFIDAFTDVDSAETLHVGDCEEGFRVDNAETQHTYSCEEGLGDTLNVTVLVFLISLVLCLNYSIFTEILRFEN